MTKDTEHSPSDEKIVEEIGDVGLRLFVLIELFGQDAVEKRMSDKLKKFEGYIENGKYTGKI